MPIVYCSNQSIARALGLSIKDVQLIASNNLFANEKVNDFYTASNPLVKELKSRIKLFRQRAKALEFLCQPENLREMAFKTLQERAIMIRYRYP